MLLSKSIRTLLKEFTGKFELKPHFNTRMLFLLVGIVIGILLTQCVANGVVDDPHVVVHADVDKS